MSLRVLITNTVMTARTGTELYVRDLARGLAAAGHTPIVYSPSLGEIADEIARTGVEVVDRPGKVSAAPDVIHGHHEIPTMTALLHFGGVPGIFVCHDRRHHSDIPPLFPRLRRYVAVDHYCRERLVEAGVADERIRVIFNGVDLERFAPRGPLPERPRRALVFSNSASERTHLPAVREACARAGLSLDVVGAGVGNACAAPEALLGSYDIVFAKGRCAAEAAAVGAAVVLCDVLGAGPLATTANLASLSRFDGATRQFWLRPLDPALLRDEIARYDAGDAAEVSRLVRAWLDLRVVVGQLVGVYREALEEQARAGLSGTEERAAAAAYLRASRGRRIRDRLKRLPAIGPWAVDVKQKIAPRRLEY